MSFYIYIVLYIKGLKFNIIRFLFWCESYRVVSKRKVIKIGEEMEIWES